MSETSEYKMGASRATIISTCKRCSEPMTGDMDSDNEEFKLECINCGFKAHFKTEDLFSFYLEATYEG